MSHKRLLVMCNAIDDEMRMERKIFTDSPAASRKIFLMSRALIDVGVEVEVISLGRGKVSFGDKTYHSINKQVSNIPVYYLPFNGIPIISQLVTIIFATVSILKYRGYDGQTSIMFYNRMPAYVGALLVSKILEFDRVLDLEDGETNPGLVSSLMRFTYDKLCNYGVLLACSRLKSMTLCRPIYCYYGVNYGRLSNKSWNNERVSCLFSGTISAETGASLLIDTVKRLRYESPSWVKNIEFFITGKGELIEGFFELQKESKAPYVRVLGRLSNDEYNKIVNNIHVGLALKPVGGAYADTTFPSKVVEFASNNILVVTTSICDVKNVLGSDGALFLDSNSPDELINKLKWIVANRDNAENTSLQGNKNINYFTDPKNAAIELSEFIFNS